MEERKLYELVLELKEISGGQELDELNVEINGRLESLRMNEPVKLILPELTLTSDIGLSAWAGDVVGATVQSVSTVFGGKLSGKLEKWFRVKGPEGILSQVKLLLVLTALRTKKHPVSFLGKKTVSRGKTQCPYLEALVSGNGGSEEVWESREFVEELRKIRISLEPDSPVKLPDFVVPEELTIPFIAELSGTQLKQVLSSLCEAAVHLSVAAEQLPTMRAELRASLNKRVELEVQSEGVLIQMREQCKGKDNELTGLLTVNQRLRGELGAAKRQLRAEQDELDCAQEQNNRLRSGNLLNSAAQVVRSEQGALLANYHKLATEARNRRKLLETAVTELSNDIENRSSETARESRGLHTETEQLTKDCEEFQTQFRALSDSNHALSKTIAAQKSALSTGNLASESAQATENYSQCCSAKTAAHERIQKLTEHLVTSGSGESSALLSTHQLHSESLSHSENESHSLDTIVIELERRLLEFSSQKITQEQHCCLHGDLLQLTEELTAFVAQSKSSPLSALEKGSIQLLSASEKALNTAQGLGVLVDSVDSAETELSFLKTELCEIQKRNPPYVPAPSDLVDNVLAEAVNSRREPLLMEFLRESAGKYKFGARTVHIKVEAGNLLLQSGTSYVTFEEFVGLHQKTLNKGRSPVRKTK